MIVSKHLTTSGRWVNMGRSDMVSRAANAVQAVRQRSYARLRRKVAARAFLAKPAFLACLQRTATAACRMQVTVPKQRTPCSCAAVTIKLHVLQSEVTATSQL